MNYKKLHEINDPEKERQIFNALCVNYSAAYCCDLRTDYMEPIKQKKFSHSARSKQQLKNPNS